MEWDEIIPFVLGKAFSGLDSIVHKKDDEDEAAEPLYVKSLTQFMKMKLAFFTFFFFHIFFS